MSRPTITRLKASATALTLGALVFAMGAPVKWSVIAEWI
jgi:hypothetical protein